MKDNAEIVESVKLKMAISNFQKEEIREMPKRSNIFKSVAVACSMILSLSGMVLAKETSTKIYDNFFLTGKGIGRAIHEGYIENTTMDYQNSVANVENEETGERIEDAETQIKVDKFVMDDFNLSVTFDVMFSEKAKQIIRADEVWEMSFPDLVLYDENDVVLFGKGLVFNRFCEERNLGYTYETVPEGKLINTGVNTFVEEKNQNHVKVVYNIYTGGDVFPKSKKLNVDLNQMKISKEEVVQGDEEITLTGNWNFSVDVPAKMYNRSNLIYQQKSTTNPDFKVISARVYDTGIDIGMEFPGAPAVEEPLTPEIKFYRSLPKDDELKNTELLNYLEMSFFYSPEYQEFMKKELERWQYEKYVTNEKGEKFGATEGPRENGGGSIDDETGIYKTNCMFDLTKYDATDTITLHLEYQGKTAEIVLEKKEEK